MPLELKKEIVLYLNNGRADPKDLTPPSLFSGYSVELIEHDTETCEEYLINSHPNVIFCSVKGITLGRWIIMVRNKKTVHTDAAERFWDWFNLQK